MKNRNGSFFFSFLLKCYCRTQDHLHFKPNQDMEKVYRKKYSSGVGKKGGGGISNLYSTAN